MEHEQTNTLMADNILSKIDNVIEKSRDKRYLSSEDIEILIEARNYISETSQKLSVNRYFQNRRSELKRIENLTQDLNDKLASNYEFVEDNFAKAEQYLRTILFGGFAVFFTLWGFTKTWIDPFWGSLAAMILLLSAMAFAVWEIFKLFIFGKLLKEHASLKVKEYLISKKSTLLNDTSSNIFLSKVRTTFNFISLFLALITLTILVIFFMQSIIVEY